MNSVEDVKTWLTEKGFGDYSRTFEGKLLHVSYLHKVCLHQLVAQYTFLLKLLLPQ